MSKPKELDLAGIVELSPFLLMGSWMFAFVGMIVACVLGATVIVAVGAGLLSAALFVGLTLEGYMRRSRVETWWALGFAVAPWLVVCYAIAQSAGLAIFAGAGVIGVGAYLIKRLLRERETKR